MNKEIRVMSNQTLADNNTVCGRAVVYESPSNNMGFVEIVKRGAITDELIQRSDVFARVNHSDDYVLARWNKGKGSLKLENREDGLYFEFEIPNTEKGNELREHIKRGEITECSFCFALSNDDNAERWYKKDGVIYREINKIGYLGDVSPVFQAAYPETNLSLRSQQMYDELRNVGDNTDTDDEPTVEPQTEETQVVDNEEVNTNTEDGNNGNDDNDVNGDDNTTNTVQEINEENTLSTGENSEERNIYNKDNKKTKSIHKMAKEFRLLKAINDIANNRNLDDVASSVVSNGIKEMRAAGLSYGGQIQLPTETRADITVTVEGEDVVATNIYDILEPLRAKNVLVGAGAKFLTGLVGDVKVPSMSASNVTWEGETAGAKDGAGTFNSVKLSPKRLTAYVDISKQFLIQTSDAAEALIRQDLINAINGKLEETVLGSAVGTTTKPQGIFYSTKTLPTISDFASLCDLEASVEDANVIGECKYIMSNKAKAVLRNMPKSAKTTQLVMEGGYVDGTQVFNTSHVGNKGIAYGDFSNLAIGQFGAINRVA